MPTPGVNTSIGSYVVGVLGFESLGAYFHQAFDSATPEKKAGELMVQLLEGYASHLNSLAASGSPNNHDYA